MAITPIAGMHVERDGNKVSINGVSFSVGDSGQIMLLIESVRRDIMDEHSRNKLICLINDTDELSEEDVDTLVDFTMSVAEFRADDEEEEKYSVAVNTLTANPSEFEWRDGIGLEELYEVRLKYAIDKSNWTTIADFIAECEKQGIA